VRALTFVLALALSVSAQAQTFDDGLAEAVKLYRKAAEQGNAEAQSNLGVMYDEGEGVLQDDAEAVKWFRLSAEQGFPKAQALLGIMYAKGEGVPVDFPIAYMWANIAAATGLEYAVETREAITASLTPSQIERGQELTRACVARNYKGC